MVKTIKNKNAYLKSSKKPRMKFFRKHSQRPIYIHDSIYNHDIYIHDSSLLKKIEILTINPKSCFRKNVCQFLTLFQMVCETAEQCRIMGRTNIQKNFRTNCWTAEVSGDNPVGIGFFTPAPIYLFNPCSYLANIKFLSNF